MYLNNTERVGPVTQSVTNGALLTMVNEKLSVAQ